MVIYHFGNGSGSWLPGGFLGVDVFFVLSGYLITGLLVDEYSRRGRINLLGFWIRRLRRLLPALLVLLVVVSAWIWWDTPPDFYPMRRADILWTLGYAANWHLINTSETYFAAYTSASPLRHTWSLSIEEQFYLVWPALVLVLMWAGRRPFSRLVNRVPGLARLSLNGRGRALVAVVATAGIGVSVWWSASNYDAMYPSQAYFSTRGRVQELFVGVVLAVLIPRLFRHRGRPLIIAVGFGTAGLLAAICLLPDNTAFFYRGGALCICLAVAAVIAGVEVYPEGVLARIFGWRPAVALGRISYGVYLWHWPLVVAIPVTPEMTASQTAVRQFLRVVITVGAATASYLVVERPVLGSRRLLRSPARVIMAAATASAVVVVLVIQATALPGTIAQQLTLHSDTACPGERNDRYLICALPAGTSAGSSPVRLALVGDSTGRALGPGLNDWAVKTGSPWVDAAWKLCTASGQMILPLGASEPDSAAQVCYGQAPGLIQEALQKYRPQVVLDAEYWGSGRTLLVDGKRLAAGTPEHDAALRAGYLKLVDQVAAYGGRVVFLELPPPGEQLGTAIATQRPAGTSRGPVPGAQYVDGFNSVLRSVAAARPASASTVSVTDVVCPGGVCSPLHGDTLVRFDGVHYTVRFTRQLVPTLIQRLGLATG